MRCSAQVPRRSDSLSFPAASRGVRGAVCPICQLATNPARPSYCFRSGPNPHPAPTSPAQPQFTPPSAPLRHPRQNPPPKPGGGAGSRARAVGSGRGGQAGQAGQGVAGARAGLAGAGWGLDAVGNGCDATPRNSCCVALQALWSRACAHPVRTGFARIDCEARGCLIALRFKSPQLHHKRRSAPMGDHWRFSI